MKYYDRAGNEISPLEADFSIEARRVALTKFDSPFGSTVVSTVHLCIDHSFGNGPPLIFESYVDTEDGTYESALYRYTTEEQARDGHEKLVGKVLCGIGPTF